MNTMFITLVFFSSSYIKNILNNYYFLQNVQNKSLYTLNDILISHNSFNKNTYQNHYIFQKTINFYTAIYFSPQKQLTKSIQIYDDIMIITTFIQNIPQISIHRLQ